MDRIYLAVGHGEKPGGSHDPGAVSADGRWNEQTAGDIIVAAAAAYLRALGVTVRDEAYQNDPNFRGTAKQANEWRANYVVSVHHDYNLAPEGAFGHWYTREGMMLANKIQWSVADAGFPLRPDWHKRRTDLSLLKTTIAPSVIYECGRIGQGSLDEPAELQRMGRAIAAGIARHIGAGEQEEDMPIDVVHDQAAIDAAQQKLIDAGLLTRPHPGSAAASVGLLMILCARLLDQVGLGGVDLEQYELRLVKRP